tara:strand:- start:4763 stop:5092 length:330 start_codon:yes stop_codon:yes gene_type:complete
MGSVDMNSSINNLIGTFATINTGSFVPVATNLVCIDTSNNRIGVNTIDPSYGIHVIGSGVDGTIGSTGLIIHDKSAVTKVILKNLPTTVNGLVSDQLYIGANGELKVAP